MERTVRAAARTERARTSVPVLVPAALLAACLAVAGCDPAGPGAAPDVGAPAATDPAGTTVLDVPAADERSSAPAEDDDRGRGEVGALAEGFPEDLLPVPDDAVVLVTTSVPVGDSPMQEVSLNFRTSASVAEVVELYREALVGAGFEEVSPATPQTDLAAESTYVRSGGDELVAIGVLDVDDGRTVTLGGRVRAET